METVEKLAAYFSLQQIYQALYSDYLKRGVVRQLDPADKENTLDSDWKLAHYFAVGADALRVSVKALHGNLRFPPASILDFPCGSGRVTRHLQAFFPSARIVACDLYEDHLSFCRSTLGVEVVVSNENLDEVRFDGQFDLIFCGSLLTHLPEPLLRSAMRLLGRALSDKGIAVVTLHGRHSDFIQRNKWKYLDDHLYEIAEKGVLESGFGYVDYQHDVKAGFDKQERYGIALVRPSWIARLLESEDNLRILDYTEREWDKHQDVLVFGRPGIHA